MVAGKGKRAPTASIPAKRAKRVCELCSDHKVFQYKPTWFGPCRTFLARLALSDELHASLVAPVWYQCPICHPVQVKCESAGSTPTHPACLPPLRNRSPWLLSKLIKSGIEPHLVYDVLAESKTPVTSITDAERLMFDKLDRSLLNLAQNTSKEFEQPAHPVSLTVMELIEAHFPEWQELSQLADNETILPFLVLLANAKRWYPLAFQTYKRALSECIMQLKDVEGLTTLIHKEKAILEEGMLLNSRSDGLQAPACLLLAQYDSKSMQIVRSTSRPPQPPFIVL